MNYDKGLNVLKLYPAQNLLFKSEVSNQRTSLLSPTSLALSNLSSSWTSFSNVANSC